MTRNCSKVALTERVGTGIRQQPTLVARFDAGAVSVPPLQIAPVSVTYDGLVQAVIADVGDEAGKLLAIDQREHVNVG